MLYNAYMTLRANRNVVYDCRYHVIWCVKYRRGVLAGEVGERLKELLYSISVELGADIKTLEVMPEHVHVLVECDPQYGIHRVVKRLKGKTSRILREEFRYLNSRLPTLWSNSYYVSTVGRVSADTIKRYIESQKRSE